MDTRKIQPIELKTGIYYSSKERKLGVETELVKKEPYFDFWNLDLMRQWLNEIVEQEWKETPLHKFDLSHAGYGEIYIKDESANPTHTHKDRLAHKLALSYKELAKDINNELLAGNLTEDVLSQIRILRLSLLSSGNEAAAIAECFKKHNFPPPKVLISSDTPSVYVAALKSLWLDLYMADISNVELHTNEILKLTDNQSGIDMTSRKEREIETETGRKYVEEIYYDSLFFEVVNELPDKVYLPYGSGRLVENFLSMQTRILFGEVYSKGNHGVPHFDRDPRLKIDPMRALEIDILGAEPVNDNSIADKLTAPFKPFRTYTNEMLRVLSKAATGTRSGIVKVREGYIRQSYKMMRDWGFEVEPSGSASLALYLQQWDEGLVSKDAKVITVNTGRGMYSEVGH